MPSIVAWQSSPVESRTLAEDPSPSNLRRTGAISDTRRRDGVHMRRNVFDSALVFLGAARDNPGSMGIDRLMMHYHAGPSLPFGSKEVTCVGDVGGQRSRR